MVTEILLIPIYEIRPVKDIVVVTEATTNHFKLNLSFMDADAEWTDDSIRVLFIVLGNIIRNPYRG